MERTLFESAQFLANMLIETYDYLVHSMILIYIFLPIL